MVPSKTTVADLPSTKDTSLCIISIFFDQRKTYKTAWHVEEDDINQPFSNL